MKFISSTLLDYSLLYGVIFFGSCIFLFALLEIYFDRKKNLWNIPGPIPLPLFGNSLLFAKAHEFFMPTVKAVSKSFKSSSSHSPTPSLDSRQIWTYCPHPPGHEAQPRHWGISRGLREDLVKQQTDHKGR